MGSCPTWNCCKLIKPINQRGFALSGFFAHKVNLLIIVLLMKGVHRYELYKFFNEYKK